MRKVESIKMERTRRAPRVTPKVRVDGHTRYGSRVRIVDLSPTGALIETPRPLEKSSRLTLELSLNRKPVSLGAVVMRSTRSDDGRFHAGIRFVHMASDTRDQIAALIHEQLRHERRRQPRVFLGKHAELTKLVEIYVLNLSLFGGLFRLDFPLEFDQVYDFVFSLPQGEVQARGVVRHCEAWVLGRDETKFQLGVEFTELRDVYRDRVVAYLEEQIQAS